MDVPTEIVFCALYIQYRSPILMYSALYFNNRVLVDKVSIRLLSQNAAQASRLVRAAATNTTKWRAGLFWTIKVPIQLLIERASEGVVRPRRKGITTR
jgi:hypothetical protein